jgi:hypothetical protein
MTSAAIVEWINSEIRRGAVHYHNSGNSGLDGGSTL